MPGTSFDRVAEIYDRTRGGERRGARLADAIAPWVAGTRIAEFGVGTGVVASGLRENGIDPVGFDLSEAMLRRAVERIGPRVAVADVERLPLADESVDTAIFVWVLHLVEDSAAALAETARVVRSGGRVVTVLAAADDHPDDEIARILSGLAPLLRPSRGLDATLAAAPATLRLEFSGFTRWTTFPATPNQAADLVEQRGYSTLFDVDDSTWQSVVVPVIEQLRAMPDPDDEYSRRNRHPLVVWTVV